MNGYRTSKRDPAGKEHMSTERPGHDWTFLLGSQYYRAPTPDPEAWERDLRTMREHGYAGMLQPGHMRG